MTVVLRIIGRLVERSQDRVDWGHEVPRQHRTTLEPQFMRSSCLRRLNAGVLRMRQCARGLHRRHCRR